MTKPKPKAYVPFVLNDGSAKGIFIPRPTNQHQCRHCVRICSAAHNIGQSCHARFRKEGMRVVFILIRKQPKRSISLRGKSSAKSNE